VRSVVQMGASALFGGEAKAASISDNLLAGLSPSKRAEAPIWTKESTARHARTTRRGRQR